MSASSCPLKAASASAQPAEATEPNSADDRPLLPAFCLSLGAATSSRGRTGVSSRVWPAAIRCPATGAITATWRNRCGPLPQPRWHVRLSLYRWTPTGPLAALDSWCPRPMPYRRSVSGPMPYNGNLQRLRCRGHRHRVRQPGELTGARTPPTRTVPARRTCRAVGVRPPWPPRRWVGWRRNLRRTPWTVPRLPSWVAVRGIWTPADGRPHPPWPASRRNRYRNRSPGRRPLVGCSHRW